ncbi:SDR family NAD(P)-dependent oxidoreductase [Streptomyces sp. NPDC020800]|uniref:SDR family NAD(P)-dependent oxidoreductase n=1 Tax=Streptomyces sp. NPDC020800 TaxID=3365092 RepID=UPI0037A2FB91
MTHNDTSTLEAKATAYFTGVLSEVIKLPADRIDARAPFDSLGLDSVMMMRMTDELEAVFGSLPKTLFFEFRDIRALTSHFLTTHGPELARHLGTEPGSGPTDAPAAPAPAPAPAPARGRGAVPGRAAFARKPLRTGKWATRFDEPQALPAAPTPAPAQQGPETGLDIAIIGLAGRYPKARTLEEFWANLAAGRDCVTEIPADRWDQSVYYDADKDAPGKTYSKWGGFVDGVDELDSLFFRISPPEAKLMDPQERLFLQCAYEAVEDAGYTPERLNTSPGDGDRVRVGVYVGVMYEEYQLYGAQEQVLGNPVALSGNPSAVANRVSYFFDFQGPSMSVDTMCSSSFTAIHLACQSIESGACDVAIAGGVNLSVHANKYLMLGQGKFVSSKGRCESFGAGGDGYVPAEGVGAVLLKPLEQAVRDGDRIHGVIKGIAVNHGGRTNGYSVPSPQAQARSISDAWRQAGVDPRALSYVEAHGTGTSLGDPIEVAGLTRAFREHTQDSQFCAIGSVKSNIGHAESAAGISGLTKVLLQMKHGQLVPSLHSEVLNPHIDFANSPFSVQQTLAEWKRPVLVVDGAEREFPRIAGISSFGAGGSNAHLVVEEYRAEPPAAPTHEGPVAVVLSARSAERLRAKAVDLADWIEARGLSAADLPSLAHTSQIGREAMRERLGIVTDSVAELLSRLRDFADGTEDDIARGRAVQGAESRFDAEVSGGPAELVDLWVRGAPVDWSVLHAAGVPPRIALPTYPFARERHWIDTSATARALRQNAPGAHVFEECWEPAPAPARQDAGPRTLVCLCSDPANQAELERAAGETAPRTTLIFVSRTPAADDAARRRWAVDAGERADWIRVFTKIRERFGAVDGVLNLWPVEEGAGPRSYTDTIQLLQAVATVETGVRYVLQAGEFRDGTERAYAESWLGFERSLGQVLPGVRFAAVLDDAGGTSARTPMADWFARLSAGLAEPVSALYRDGTRHVSRVRPATAGAGNDLLKQGGTYLITGGLGALGLLFAEHLAGTRSARLVLTGRSPLDEDRARRIARIESLGGEVHYEQADVADRRAMREVVRAAHERFGGIDGVIHAAGVPGTGSVLTGEARAFPGLLAAKVDGTLVLDEVLADEPLDFVCYFSSSSAQLGDFGGCDYAVGNRFQTLYARHRDELVRQGARSGATVAVNWPLWRDGEMGFDDARATELYLTSSGQRLLENADGIRLFERLIGQGVPQALVMAGEPQRLRRLLGIDEAPTETAETAEPVVPAASASAAGPDHEHLAARVLSDLETLIVETVRVPRDQIHADENLAQLGFDSITLVRLANAMTTHFGVDVVPSVFFSHPTPEMLVAHLVSEHPDQLDDRYLAEPAAEAAPAAAENRPEARSENRPEARSENRPEARAAAPAPAATATATATATAVTATPSPEPGPESGPEPIAVIAMTGRFPAARTVDEFWRILTDGRDVLSAVPDDRRADWSDPQDLDPATARVGFVPGIGEFDPAFFEISPREARTMDPRQRLLLQEAWHVLEAAGYGERKLRDERIGMFVGAEQGDYLHLGGGEGTLTGHHEAILASRLGYLLDFTGPVLAVNTACSSGLVASHQACASLRNGECDAAIVAGVNLAASSRVFAETSKAGMLSPSGACYAFDRRADGMVLGEAITVVMFKRLSQAEADGDDVLAVIRGSGINYDGRTNGITAPNGAAQARLYRAVYERHGIDPGHIGHVVAHGTGTRLGDPVEVNALNEVFSEHTDRTGFCALTSTKPNVGHTLAASGLVSLIALVQSVRHGVIPPSMHCEQDSDYIAWQRSPFYVNKTLKAWPENPAGTRLGAVSSFGMSGTNVHMVVESYRGRTRAARPAEAPARLLALSAKTAGALRDRIRDLGEALRSADRDAVSLTDVSHTLLERRQHFEHRCAIVVGDLDEAVSVLGAAERGEQHAGVSFGEVPGDRRDRPRDAESQALSARLADAGAAEHRDVLLGLADLYCRGASPDWQALFAGDDPQLVAVPGYPFSRKVYWVNRENSVVTRPLSHTTVEAAEEPSGPVGGRRRVTLRNPAEASAVSLPTAAKPRNVRLADLGERSAAPVAPVAPAAPIPPPADPVAAPVPAAVQADAVPVKAVGELRQELRSGLADVLQMPEGDIDPGRNFMDLGLDSILGVEWVRAINKKYGTDLAATNLYDHPSVRELADFVRGRLAASAPVAAVPAQAAPVQRAPVAVAPAPVAEPLAAPASARPRVSKAALLEGVRDSLSDVLFLAPEDIAADRNFVELGMDSIVGVEWVKVLNKNYGTSLAATQLYDHPTVRKLTEFLLTLVESAPVVPAPAAPVAAPEPVQAAEPVPHIAPVVGTAPVAHEPAPAARAADKVAVVGMSGRYPEAADLNAYWDNLRGGRDCVTEVPPSRWDVSQYYDPRPGQEGKTYSKWLGYLADADHFDPLFFNISPLEAEGIDPQHRLFLQEAYRAFEDAGYDPQSLASQKCGVYLGISGSEYSFLVFGGDGTSASATSSSNAIAASRIAYYLNLKGPAVAVDTACSSSLVALHLARQALLSGEIDMALVGGVSLYLLPDTYVGMCQAGMLSPEGRCKTFDNSADGFVPGEGVGALVLKRLSDAEADRDHVHGVVAASGINQDGRTNGITAPSAASQMELVRTVYERHGIDPATIGYVEMHGTGTKLGDPIELSALGTVYGESGVPARSCAIGAVKSNIGHTSEAAGVAGVHKVLLSMRHRTLAPSLNFESPNEHFDFENSSFRVVTAPEPWETPSDGRPRRAAVSSFGFSGTNAHVVLEEYRAGTNSATAGHESVVVLSARTGEQLDDLAENLLAFINDEPRPDLARLAYTLQVGREAMEERLAFVAGSLSEVVRGLRAHLDRADQGAPVRGRVTPDQLAGQEDDERQQALVRTWTAAKDLRRLAQAWTEGCAVDWAALHTGPVPLRLPLPTYPFAKERYWVEPEPRTASASAAVLHPLLHRNTSGFAAQRYTSTFTGDEDFLTGHRVRGQKVLPGAAYLELALAAVADASETTPPTGLALTDVVWTRPFQLSDSPRDLHITLRRDDAPTTYFEVLAAASDAEGDAVSAVHGAGSVVPLADDAADRAGHIDIARLRDECGARELDAAQVYAAFGAAGIEYGDSFRCVEQVLVGEGQALARLVLPAAARPARDGYLLHPGLTDAALQATLGVLWNTADVSRPLLPFAMKRVEVLGALEDTMWVWVRESADGPSDPSVRRLDLDLCDDTGRVRVRMRGFSVRAAADGGAPEDAGILLFPRWQRHELPKPARSTGGPQHALVCAELGAVADALASDPTCEVLVLTSRATTADGRYADYALQVFEKTKAILRDSPRAETLVQVVVRDRPEAAALSGLGALVWSARQENPGILGQVVVVDDYDDVAALRARLVAERLRPEDATVRYRGGRREVVVWDEERAADRPRSPWRTGGVYVITGGLGGLGRIFAEEIAGQVDDVTLVLTGRSPETEHSRRFLAELRAAGARVSYTRLDVTDRAGVDALVADTLREAGRIDGVIHSAGVREDNFILKKSGEEFARVLPPKVNGTVNLDEATRDVDLDFFVMFSSGAAVTGNMGQADYATANAFMDAYAEYRRHLVARGERRGRTLSINWSLWAEGGMRPDATSEEILRERFGITPLRREAGLEAFARCLRTSHHQVLVVAGDVAAFRSALKAQHPSEDIRPMSAESGTATPTSQENDLAPAAVNYIKSLLATALKVPWQRIEADLPMERYGIDSVMALTMTARLEEVFGRLPKTLFFEYQNITALAGYFLAVHEARLRELLGAEAATAAPGTPVPEPAPRTALTTVPAPVAAPAAGPAAAVPPAADIAIIGLGGRYPQARNLREFWRNLSDGRDSIVEIPRDRWDHSLYHDTDASQPGKTYCKWGGFLDDIDRFDPQFFNISPREAEVVDPQERLFLECVYETLQDAGYTRQALREYRSNGVDANVGLFVGVMYDEYQLYGVGGQGAESPQVIPGNSASIANRVSYFCDWHGPSVTVKTMCSSSLTALHLACQSLRVGDCEVAVAGGVNLSLHPAKYLLLGQTGFASSRGMCESFGSGGDGYVPGEGVGAVLLKPLDRAIADNDRIYGVIKSTAVNHGGRTNGYTVPNPNAQAATIASALDRAGVDARTVSYVEAHGTGTELGDPIEIAGLTKAFSRDTDDRQFCAIGSVKSNIGHCESAAGISALTKVLLQLQHRKLVPSLHAEVLNPHIDFAETPFRMQREAAEWKRPTVTGADGRAREYPRIAGISSFGAGGSNAHIIVSEYVPAETAAPEPVADPLSSVVVVSARTAEQLRESAQRLLDWAEEERITDADLPDIAYTLQVGREHMDERLAFIAGSVAEFVAGLRAHVENGEAAGPFGLYRGKAQRSTTAVSSLFDDEDMTGVVDAWLRKRKLGKLLELWVNGLSLDWRGCYATPRRRVALPTYPFARKRSWIPGSTRQESVADVPARAEAKPVAKPKPAPVAAEAPEAKAAEPARTTVSAGTAVTSKPRGIGLAPLGGAAQAPAPRAVPSVVLTAAEPVPERTAESAPVPVPAVAPVAGPDEETLAAELTALLAEALYLAEDEIDPEANFTDLGLDSIVGVEWIKAINKRYGLELAATRLYDTPTVTGLVAHLKSLLPTAQERPQVQAESQVREEPVAVVAEAVVETVVEAVVEAGPVLDEDQVRAELLTSLADALYLSEDELDLDRNFTEFGLDSIVGVEWIKAINKRYGIALQATKLYDHPSVQELAARVVEEAAKTGGAGQPRRLTAPVAVPAQAPVPAPVTVREPVVEPEPATEPVPTPAPVPTSAPVPAPARTRSAAPADAIAVVGMAGKYPLAEDLDEYWDNLANGRDCVREIPASRWDVTKYYDPRPNQPGKVYCKWMGLLDDVDVFDPLFFGIPPAEAEAMDPQQRLFLQEAYHAFEDAGYDVQGLSGQKCGVYLGIMSNEYSALMREQGGDASSATSNSNAITAARIAYILNLRGPAIALDTACSSSLVGTHLATQALRSGEIDMALVGGVTLYLTAESYISMCGAGMLAPDGRCKTFDNAADGFVPGEGVGALVLKRLADAERDGDTIHGVISGSGINQDGRTNGITAPNAASQRELQHDVYERYGVDPGSISYVEMHGTGTKLGDPIELEALASVYREKTDKVGYCAIGSVKSNVGHTSAAAGVAAVQKTLLCMKNKQLVPTLHFNTPNEHFDFENSPFYVNIELAPWKVGAGETRRAAVSSFGFSGTNAHLVLEEYDSGDEDTEPAATAGTSVFVLSAKGEEQLAAVAERIKDHVEAHPSVGLRNLAYSLQTGREAMTWRLAFAAATRGEFVEKVTRYLAGGPADGLFTGRVKARRVKAASAAGQEPVVPASGILTTAQGEDLADRWVRGSAVDWTLLYPQGKPRRVPLPAYPFAREHYWLGLPAQAPAAAPVADAPTVAKPVADAPTVAQPVAVDPNPGTNVLLKPVWDAVPRPEPVGTAGRGGRVVVIGGTGQWERIRADLPSAERFPVDAADTVETLAERLLALDGPVDHLIWAPAPAETAAGADDALVEAQEGGLYACFRTLKALLRTGYAKRPLEVTVLTERSQRVRRGEHVDPSHSGVHGLMGSVAKEYPGWNVRLVDLDGGNDLPLAEVLALPQVERGSVWAHRRNRWYLQALVPLQGAPQESPDRPVYRRGGTYVVIGGAGGIGEVWTERLIRDYGAHVVWIGRREEDAAIREKLRRLAEFGPAPSYVRADAADRQSLRRAYEQIKRSHPVVHGVVHSAIVLLDQSIERMDEERFRAAVTAKIDVSVRMAQVFGEEPLDFMLFFSSMNSFMKAPGQSNYVAGSVFEDSYAQHLAGTTSFPTKIMNWGYWGSVGVVATPEHQERMSRAGAGSIVPADGMSALDVLLGGAFDQLGLVKDMGGNG